MILFKYCDEKGIDLIQNTRIKIANLSDINDAFEFLLQWDIEFEEFSRAIAVLSEYQKMNYRILSLSKYLTWWGKLISKPCGFLFTPGALNAILIKGG